MTVRKIHAVIELHFQEREHWESPELGYVGCAYVAPFEIAAESKVKMLQKKNPRIGYWVTEIKVPDEVEVVIDPDLATAVWMMCPKAYKFEIDEWDRPNTQFVFMDGEMVRLDSLDNGTLGDLLSKYTEIANGANKVAL